MVLIVLRFTIAPRDRVHVVPGLHLSAILVPTTPYVVMQMALLLAIEDGAKAGSPD